MGTEVISLPVRRLERLAPEVFSLEIGPARPALDWRPGQWVSVHLPAGKHPPLVRAYTLAAPPDGSGVLPLVFDHVPGGLGSSYMMRLREGDTVDVAAIVGKFVLPDPLPPALLFGARYTGVVPIRAMLLALQGLPSPPHVSLVYGARRAEDLVFHDEFLALAERVPWFEYFPTVPERPSGGWDGAVGEEIDLLRARYAENPTAVPMLAGVRAFTQPARAFFLEQGLDRRSVKVESYD